MRILIVEDEKRLAEALAEILTEQKYSTDVVHDGVSGLDYAMSGIYDGIILDVMLPGMNGFEIVRSMRDNQISTPVLLLTAKDEIADKVRGLDSGADDYLTKPFSAEELLARVRALTRRKGDIAPDELVFGDVSLDTGNFLLKSRDKSVRLGMKEFEVMQMLMRSGGNVVSKELLLEKVWGAESNAEDNNVEAYISFLRKKLFFVGSKVSIATVRKIGYYLSEDAQ